MKYIVANFATDSNDVDFYLYVDRTRPEVLTAVKPMPLTSAVDHRRHYFRMHNCMNP